MQFDEANRLMQIKTNLNEAKKNHQLCSKSVAFLAVFSEWQHRINIELYFYKCTTASKANGHRTLPLTIKLQASCLLHMRSYG